MPSSPRERRVPQSMRALLIVAEGRLQSEKHGGAGTQALRVGPPRQFRFGAHGTQHVLIIRPVVAAQLRQRSAFAPPFAPRTILVRDPHVPRPPFGINPARRAGRLFEMEKPRKNIYMQLSHVLVSCAPAMAKPGLRMASGSPKSSPTLSMFPYSSIHKSSVQNLSHILASFHYTIGDKKP